MVEEILCNSSQALRREMFSQNDITRTDIETTDATVPNNSQELGVFANYEEKINDTK